MLKLLENFFEKARGRKLVAIEFLKHGIRIDSKAKIYFGKIEIAPAKIARTLGVDRRVVIETAKSISKNEKLLQIFHRLEPRAFIGKAAKEFGFDTIEIRANPKKKGIVAAVTKILAEEKILIRQIITDDPDLFPDPVLTIIIQGKLKPKAIKKLKELEFAESVLIK